jgi:hypothetical protein
MKRWSFVALLLVGATFLGATVLREPIASAAQSISANIVSPLDGNGNVAVHERGTADVNVTNRSVAVTPPTPVTAGGGSLSYPGGTEATFRDQTATAIAVHMDAGIGALRLFEGGTVAAEFTGPAHGAASDVVLPLTRPITFNHVICDGNGGSNCIASWVGAEP